MELFLQFGLGLTDAEQTQKMELGDGTKNFYPDPDGQGYLQNYPGKTAFFRESEDAHVGTPPALEAATRVHVFRDARGREHIVFVQGDKLRTVVGNGYRDLYQFLGYEIGGLFFPTLFSHEAKLIIVSFGDPVLIWDGMDKVNPLGVQETPLPPDVRVQMIPESEDVVSATTYTPWHWIDKWWSQQRIINGLGENLGIDGELAVYGVYDSVIQFQDKYGNKGRISPPCHTFRVKPNSVLSSGAESVRFAVADNYPPLKEDHIHAVIWGRTLNQNQDAGLGAPGVYYREAVRADTCYSRITMTMSDAVLAANGLIDTTVTGPTQASLGCSWKAMIILAGHEDRNLVTWSDEGFFGQFRSLNSYRAADHVRATVPMDDRVIIITRSTCETLYKGAAGMAVLGQDFANGSLYGRSFVDVGNGTIFGLWNRGFGYFDGTKHEFVDFPHYLSAAHMDSSFYSLSAIRTNDWYILTVRKDALTSKNNFILKYHFRLRRWYLLEESVYDLCQWREGYLGVDDTIYELYKGTYAEAKVVVHGFLPPQMNPTTQRSISELRIFMEASSSGEAEVVIRGGVSESEEAEGTFSTLPSVQAVSRNSKPMPYWSTKFEYPAKFTAPRDVWITPIINKSISGFTHTIELTFPAGHQVRLKAMSLNVTNEGTTSK